MSIQALKYVKDRVLPRADLNQYDKHVLMFMAYVCNEKQGHVYWGSIADIMKYTGMSEPTVHRVLARLIDKEFIFLIKRGGISKRERWTNTWKVKYADGVTGAKDDLGSLGDTLIPSAGHTAVSVGDRAPSEGHPAPATLAKSGELSVSPGYPKGTYIKEGMKAKRKDSHEDPQGSLADDSVESEESGEEELPESELLD
jgi:hypothetical protein